MMQTERDCGFEFRRKAPPAPAPSLSNPSSLSQQPLQVCNTNNTLVQTATTTTSTAIEQSTKLPSLPKATAITTKTSADKRRRRSSFATSIKSTTRPSSLHLGISQTTPPGWNVAPRDLHKHILPDMPGPLKMKQLMIWAAQMAARSLPEGGGECVRVRVLGDSIVQGLVTNQINCSWYQRPLMTPIITSSTTRPNPINQEWLESMAHYERLLNILQTELATWKKMETTLSNLTTLPEPSSSSSSSTLTTQSGNTDALMQWFSTLPISLDRLDWMLHVSGSFEAHSKQFCENVFSLIFQRFFATSATAATATAASAQADPRMVLQALSWAGGATTTTTTTTRT